MAYFNNCLTHTVLLMMKHLVTACPQTQPVQSGIKEKVLITQVLLKDFLYFTIFFSKLSMFPTSISEEEHTLKLQRVTCLH